MFKLRYIFIVYLLISFSLFSQNSDNKTEKKEKKSYVQIIGTDPLIDKALAPYVSKKLKMWSDTTELNFEVKDQKFSLEELIDLALKHNNEIKQIHTEVNKAKVGLMGAKSLYFPKIDFQASLSWFWNPLDPIMIDRGELGTVQVGTISDYSLPPSNYVLYDGSDNSFYNFGIKIEQPLFTWGKIPAAVETYKGVLRAAELQLEKKIREVKATIIGYYYALFYLNKIDEIIKKQNSLSDRLVFLTRTSFETGFLVLTDYKDVEVKVQDIVIAKHKIEENYYQIEYSISKLLGFDIKLDNVNFDGAEKIIENLKFYEIDQYISKSFSDSVEMQLLKEQVSIYENKYIVAKADNYLKPTIGLRTELGYSSTSFPFFEPGWITSGSPRLSLSVGISSRVFDAGERLSQILTEKESYENAKYQLKSGEDNIKQTVQSLYSKINLNYKNIDYYNLHELNFLRHTETSSKRFKAGQIRELDNIRSNLEYYTSQTKPLTEKIDLITNFCKLMYLTDDLELFFNTQIKEDADK